MTKLKLAYFGTPDFSANLLERLITDPSIKNLIEVVLVVTQPDRAVGRKQILTPTPVKTISQKFGIPVYENLESIIHNSELKGIDLCLLYAFGKKIPRDLLNLPRLGFINIHPSLLPKYRGPSPIAYPLINGDKKTGVTLMKMDEQIDHGPIIAQEELEILPTDKHPDLEKKLTDLAFKMFNKMITQLRITNYEFKTIKQNHQKATYTKLIKKQDGFIPYEELKELIRNPFILEGQFVINNKINKFYNLFKGLYKWPGLWTLLRPPIWEASEGQAQKRLKITDVDFKDGKLIIRKVQLEGKKEVDFVTFQKAYNFL